MEVTAIAVDKAAVEKNSVDEVFAHGIDEMLLKVSIVNATVGELKEEVNYLRAASQIALLMQGLHFLALVTYVVAIAVMSCRKRVEKVRAKMEEEQVELLEKRLQDKRSLRRKEAKPTAQ